MSWTGAFIIALLLAILGINSLHARVVMVTPGLKQEVTVMCPAD